MPVLQTIKKKNKLKYIIDQIISVVAMDAAGGFVSSCITPQGLSLTANENGSVTEGVSTNSLIDKNVSP